MASIRAFARPWPVVKLFRECMERDLRPDPIPDAIWNLASNGCMMLGSADTLSTVRGSGAA